MTYRAHWKMWLYICSQMGLLHVYDPIVWSWDSPSKESSGLTKRPIYTGFLPPRGCGVRRETNSLRMWGTISFALLPPTNAIQNFSSVGVGVRSPCTWKQEAKGSGSPHHTLFPGNSMWPIFAGNGWYWYLIGVLVRLRIQTKGFG